MNVRLESRSYSRFEFIADMRGQEETASFDCLANGSKLSHRATGWMTKATPPQRSARFIACCCLSQPEQQKSHR